MIFTRQLTSGGSEVKMKHISDIVKKSYKLVFRVHALRQMFNRRIGEADVQEVVRNGRIIEEYPDDKPYPSYLIYGSVNDRPLHVVGAYDKEEGMIIVITAYEPDPDLWEDQFTRRKS